MNSQKLFPNEQEKIYDSIEKALGEPFALEFSEYARRIRNSLFFISSLSLVITTNNIKIDLTNSSLLGLHFEGITNELIIWLLLILNLYFLLHFLWVAIDYFNEWVLRSTGAFNAFSGRNSAFSNDQVEALKDPRQSTLYHWWIVQVRNIQIIEGDLKECKQLLESIQNNNKINQDEVTKIMSDFGWAKHALDNAVEVIKGERIKVSLDRFDGWFKRALKIQNLRWIVLELLLPSVLGVLAIILLLTKI